MKKVIRIFFLLVFLLSGKNIFSSHNRAGEITYKWLFGYTYEINVTTYTSIAPGVSADRCYDTVYFGDGTFEALPRINGVTNNKCPGNVGDGVGITPNIKLNLYKTTHTFPGPNCYILTMADPNRNQGVLNMTNSENQPFFIECELCIGAFSGPNNSPVLSNPPIDNACSGHCFIHNAGAYDADGDSLSYHLTDCLGDFGQPVFGFQLPSGISMNSVTGDFKWCSPTLQGEYNFAFIIKEWRRDSDGNYHEVGFVERDMQITVGACNNIEPTILDLPDTCVVAGTILTIPVTATDPDSGQLISLTSYGGPYVLTPPHATFVSTDSVSPASATFSWNTSCLHVRYQPYMVTVKAEDNDPKNPLVDFKTFFITVVGPAPANLLVQPSGTSMIIKWNKDACAQTTGNYIYKYLIYRIDTCLNWTHSPCETGVSSTSGFTLIGSTNGLGDTTFVDNNNGLGLTHGTDYTYMVVGLFGDGAQTYASTPVCNHLLKDVPILTNVDVKTTDASTGQIFVRWVKPVVNASDPDKLDTLANPGPYEFRLMEHSGFNGTFTQIYSVTKNYFAQINALADTTYTSVNLNTTNNPYTYRVDFYCNGTLKGTTQTASSYFLNAASFDNKIKLSWTGIVPWTNSKYFIYKESAQGSGIWNLIGNTTLTTYTDSGLVNGVTYCYKVLTQGKYTDPDILSPLLNYTQEICAQPVDKEPPCQPEMTIDADCNLSQVKVSWRNPNNYCCNDALKYKIYYKPTLTDPYALLDSFMVITDTIYVYDGTTSIAGCFAVTAIDSFGNESPVVANVCTDNCPEYELPNIITLNGDNINDFFIPVKNKFIKDIDLRIYDRWGLLVFQTTDQFINWDGRNKQTKQFCTNGTYFYTCDVNEIHIDGIRTKTLKGFVQVIDK